MAQNITLLGASYSDVPAVTLPKTGGGTAQFDDTTDADATAGDIASGKTAYVNGTKLTGTGSGGGVTTEALSVTANGTYTAPTGKAYTPVTVNVAGSVEGEVRFIDYDGTVLYTYTPAQFAALSALPANPSHTGLTAQGWNWSLANAKTYMVDHPEAILSIGQMYVTDDGKTRIYIRIDADTPSNRMTFYVRFKSSASNNTTIDWGDGTTETKGSTSTTNHSHTYASVGDYVIKLTVNSGTISFIGSSSISIYGSTSGAGAVNRTRIKKIEFGNSIIFGTYAVSACYGMESVTIPKGVSLSSTYIFNQCYKLEYVTIPSEMTAIGNYCFYQGRLLQTVSIPHGVTSIGTYCFASCSTMTQMAVPDSVTSLGASAFMDCWNLLRCTVSKLVTVIGDQTFSTAKNMEFIKIPSGVTTIGKYAIYTMSKIETIELPSTLTTMDEYALANNYALRSISVPSNVTAIPNNCFTTCNALESVTLPSGLKTIGTNAFSTCSKLANLSIPNGVTSIGNSAFGYMYSLKSISIPATVTSIGTSAFTSCQELETVALLCSLTEIPAYMFSTCSSLRNIDIPNTVTSIGGSAFSACTSLATLTIPSTVTSIGTSAFSGCTGIGEYHFEPTTPPTLASTNAFASIQSDCKFYVPYSADHSVLNNYKTASNWSNYSSRMQEEPQ